MKQYSVFDVLGPVMIGPSSSHTAGAARIGKVARCIAGDDFHKVAFYLHGSFANTYKGHGTDRALVAGVLGMEPHDIRLSQSLKIASEKHIDISFHKADLGLEHPNTVKVVFYHSDDQHQTEVMGSSIGGGNIVITKVNGYSIKFKGDYPTLLIFHRDQKGVIRDVSDLLSINRLNVAKMKVSRKVKGHGASMVIETDDVIPAFFKKQLLHIDHIDSVSMINPTREVF